MVDVLIVEDDVDLQAVCRARLSALGYNLTIVDTAEQALELVGGRNFDLAVIDLMLPGMDGAELVRRLRGRTDEGELPLIVFTGVGGEGGLGFEQPDDVWLPADVVVQKSEGIHVLAETAERVLEEARRTRPQAHLPRADALRHVFTTCPNCSAGCGMYLKVRRDSVVGVEPARSHPVSSGRLCARGWTAFEAIMHPDRLKQPMVRKAGRLVPASWEEAVDLCAARFTQIRDEYGGDSLGVVASARCTNEENYLVQKLARAVFGTNNVDHCSRRCDSSTFEALSRSLGCGAMSNSIGEIAGAGCILVVCSDLTETHPVVASEVRRAKDNGAVLVVADSRTTDVASWADIHIRQMPGTEPALFNAMAHVIVSEGLEHKRFISERTEGFEAFWKAASASPPETVADICRVPADLVRQAARAYAAGDPSSIICSFDAAETTIGGESAAALANLAMLTGNFGRRSSGLNPLRARSNSQGACDMGALPDEYPGRRKVSDDAARRTFEEAWQSSLPREAGFTVADMLAAAGDGRIKAMYVIGEDVPAASGDAGLNGERLEKLEFLVCQDIFPNEACRFADVVLPAATFAEKDGTFTSAERRVQRIRRAVPPVANAWPDWRIICEISSRMGRRMEYVGPSQVMDEIASLTPDYGGISYARIEKEGVQWPCVDAGDPGTPFLYEGKFTSGAGRFCPVRESLSPPALDGRFPLLLSTGKTVAHYDGAAVTARTETLRRELRGCFCMISPVDARRYGVEPGAVVKVITRWGSVTATADVTESIRPDVIWMPLTLARGLDAGFSSTAGAGPGGVCAARIEPESPSPGGSET